MFFWKFCYGGMIYVFCANIFTDYFGGFFLGNDFYLQEWGGRDLVKIKILLTGEQPLKNCGQ